MSKQKAAKAPAPTGKPKVVFDLKMPEYTYRKGEDKSLSVDRKRGDAGKPNLDCLANLRA